MAAIAEHVLRHQGRLWSLVSTRAFKRLLHALFVLALLLAGIALATVLVPRAFGYGTLAVLSGSMGPSAPTGSLVIGSWHRPMEIEVGDVVLVRREGKAPVLHRVISRELRDGSPVVHLKGDANPAPDPESYTLPDRVLRKERAIPLVGYAVAILRMPTAWLVLVVLPTIFLAASVLRDVWRPQEKPEQKQEAAVPLEGDDDKAPATRDIAETLAAHDRRIRDRELELATLEARLTARDATLERREAALRARAERLEAREAAHIQTVLETHAAIEAARVEQPSREREPNAPHLMFFPSPSGYSLLERDTALPGVGTIVEAEGAQYTVTRVSRSPLPFDRRRCAYLQRL